MTVFVIKFGLDHGLYHSGIRTRSILANNEREAKRNLFSFLHQREEKFEQGKWWPLSYFDIDFYDVEAIK